MAGVQRRTIPHYHQIHQKNSDTFTLIPTKPQEQKITTQKQNRKCNLNGGVHIQFLWRYAVAAGRECDLVYQIYNKYHNTVSSSQHKKSGRRRSAFSLLVKN
jgi:hypothetical protein